MTSRRIRAGFIEPMLLLRKENLPAGKVWMFELKLDGYRAIAFKSASKVQLRSRNENDFTARYPGVSRALQKMPDETVLDGEVVALDEEGRPSFNLLQNYGVFRNSSALLRFRPSGARRQGFARRTAFGAPRAA